jgi:hypothetical protein
MNEVPELTGRTNVANGETRAPWEHPKLTFEGNLHEIVLGGTGKNTVAPKDPGENAKVQL